MNNRLATIASAQKKTRVRDAIFAAFVVLGAAIAVTSVSAVASSASTHVAQR